jgi:hypothetical protein
MRRFLGAALIALSLSIGSVVVAGPEDACAGYWGRVAISCSRHWSCPYPYGMRTSTYRWFAGNEMTGYYPTTSYKTQQEGCWCEMW